MIHVVYMFSSSLDVSCIKLLIIYKRITELDVGCCGKGRYENLGWGSSRSYLDPVEGGIAPNSNVEEMPEHAEKHQDMKTPCRSMCK